MVELKILRNITIKKLKKYVLIVNKGGVTIKIQIGIDKNWWMDV